MVPCDCRVFPIPPLPMHYRLSLAVLACSACLMPVTVFGAATKTASSSSKVSVQVTVQTNAQLEAKARKGDIDAAYDLGMRYYTGDTKTKTKKDDKKAVVWLSLAILEGKQVANQYELETYFSQHLTDKDRDTLTDELNAIMANIPALRGRTDISLDATQDLQRKKDIAAVADALIKYYSDHKKKFPVSLPKKLTDICRVSGPDCKTFVNIGDLLGQYIKALPIDPTAKVDSKSTGYMISADKGVLTITAPKANEKNVKVVRSY